MEIRREGKRTADLGQRIFAGLFFAVVFLLSVAAAYGSFRLLGPKIFLGCFLFASTIMVASIAKSKKPRRKWWIHTFDTIMISMALPTVIAGIYGVALVLGWEIFLGCIVSALIATAILAQIRLRAANALARRYAKIGAPQGATNVQVYFRSKFFKMATLGWLMGGESEFRPISDRRHLIRILQMFVDRQLYLNPGKLGGAAWGKLLHVGNDDNERIGAMITLESYIGDDFGVVPTMTSSEPIRVIVSFESNLSQEQWVQAKA